MPVTLWPPGEKGKIHNTGGLNHLPYLLSISVSMAVKKDLSTGYKKALGPNQAYEVVKIMYQLVYICICSVGN